MDDDSPTGPSRLVRGDDRRARVEDDLGEPRRTRRRAWPVRRFSARELGDERRGWGKAINSSAVPVWTIRPSTRDRDPVGERGRVKESRA